MSAEYQQFQRLLPQGTPGTAALQQHTPDPGTMSQVVSPGCPYANDHVMSIISCTTTFLDENQIHNMQSTVMKHQIPLWIVLDQFSVNLNFNQFKYRKIIVLQDTATNYPKSIFKENLVKYVNLS